MATGATHPATAYFCTQLHALAQTKRVRDLDTGRTRKITARTIHTLLIEACPTIAPSQTSWYRAPIAESAHLEQDCHSCLNSPTAFGVLRASKSAPIA